MHCLRNFSSLSTLLSSLYDSYELERCDVTSDPNVKTFDGVYYSINETGNFIYIRNLSYVPVEVSVAQSGSEMYIRNFLSEILLCPSPGLPTTLLRPKRLDHKTACRGFQQLNFGTPFTYFHQK